MPHPQHTSQEGLGEERRGCRRSRLLAGHTPATRAAEGLAVTLLRLGCPALPVQWPWLDRVPLTASAPGDPQRPRRVARPRDLPLQLPVPSLLHQEPLSPSLSRTLDPGGWVTRPHAGGQQALPQTQPNCSWRPALWVMLGDTDPSRKGPWLQAQGQGLGRALWTWSGRLGLQGVGCPLSVLPVPGVASGGVCVWPQKCLPWPSVSHHGCVVTSTVACFLPRSKRAPLAA